MGRKFFVGGNWKMNGTKANIDTIIDFLSKGPLDPNAGIKYISGFCTGI
jgi:triosephosphate isomerase (TIM)